MKTNLLIFCFIAFATACAHSAVVAQSPAAPLTVEQVLQSACDRLVAADQLAADVEFAVKIGPEGLEHGRFARYQLRADRPERFSLSRYEGDLGATLVSDGQTLTTYFAELQQYTEQPAPASLDEFSNSTTGMMALSGGMGGFLMALFADDPHTRLTSQSTASEYVGTEFLDDVECHRLHFVQDDWDFDIWVTSGDEPTLRRIRPDLSKGLSDEEREMGFSIVLSLEFTGWDLDSELTDEHFAIDLPASAELVDEITPQAPAPVAPPIVTVHPLIGQPAPGFALVHLNGETAFSLKEDIGQKVIVLDFWATWCGPCVAALPKISDMAEKYEGKQVAFYAVNIEEDAKTIGEFLEAADPAIKLPVLLDSQATVAGKYEVRGIPQTVLIGLDGRVHVVHIGFPGDFSDEIDALLERKDLAGEAIARAEGMNDEEEPEGDDKTETPNDPPNEQEQAEVADE